MAGPLQEIQERRGKVAPVFLVHAEPHAVTRRIGHKPEGLRANIPAWLLFLSPGATRTLDGGVGRRVWVSARRSRVL